MNSLTQNNKKVSIKNDILMEFLLYDIAFMVEEYISDCDIIINNLSVEPIKYIDLIIKLKEINDDNTINEISINCIELFNLNEDYFGLFTKVAKINGNVKCIGNMSKMFMNCEKFIKLGDNCDTTYVTDMSYMFCNANNFNQLLNWDTSNVNNMEYMFYRATNFNQELNWNIINVNNLSFMFSYAINFNQKLNWNTINVNDMSYMFYVATNFNKKLKWDTKNVIDMAGLFSHATNFNQKVNWDIRNVTDISGMFYNTTNLNQEPELINGKIVASV